MAEPPALHSLTIESCIEQALARNLDLRLERIGPEISRWDIVREQGAFEPAWTASARYQDSTEPLDPERETALGLSRIDSETFRLGTGVEGTLPTGTAYRLDAFNIGSEGTLAPDPVHVGNVALTLKQPLLRNFWIRSNTSSLRVARKNRAIARETFIARVINIVTEVQNAYYELVFAIENHRAKQQDLAEAEALLAENRERLEVGVVSPLDVVQAEAGVAERRESVIITARSIKERENDLKRLISDDVLEFRGTTLVPATTPLRQDLPLDSATHMRTALAGRPDYQQALHEVQKQGIQVAFNRNQLWPQLDLETSYGLNGRGGSFGEFVDSTGSGDNPEWSVGVVVRIPLGNRQTRADYQTALLEEERALLRLKQAEQEIIIEIDNAIGAVEANRERVTATAAAVRLAEESLRAETERLKNGLSTSLLVLQAQAALAEARAASIRAHADYNKSLVTLEQADATTLVKHGIEIED